MSKFKHLSISFFNAMQLVCHHHMTGFQQMMPVFEQTSNGKRNVIFLILKLIKTSRVIRFILWQFWLINLFVYYYRSFCIKWSGPAGREWQWPPCHHWSARRCLRSIPSFAARRTWPHLHCLRDPACRRSPGPLTPWDRRSRTLPVPGALAGEPPSE